jgi:hypothetical protein
MACPQKETLYPVSQVSSRWRDLNHGRSASTSDTSAVWHPMVLVRRVKHAGTASCVHQHIGRLEVAVHYPCSVGRHHCVQKINHERNTLRRWHDAALLYQLVQCLPSYVLKNHVGLLAMNVCLKHGSNIGLHYAPYAADFLPPLHDRLFIARGAWVHHCHGDFAFALYISQKLTAH